MTEAVQRFYETVEEALLEAGEDLAAREVRARLSTLTAREHTRIRARRLAADLVSRARKSRDQVKG